MGYKGFGPQLNRSFRAGNKIANDVTKMLLLGGAYVATKTYGSLNSNTSYTRSEYRSATARFQPTSSKEPLPKIDFPLLSSHESAEIKALKQEYNRDTENYTRIDNEIKILIHKRNQLIKSIDAIDWIKWLFKKRILRLETELREVQNQISSLSSKQSVAKVNIDKLTPHSNFENIMNEGENLLDGACFVRAKYDIPLKETFNYRELFDTTFIRKGSVPEPLGKSDCYLNLYGGDFTLSFTPIGILFIAAKEFYIFEYSGIKVSYRTIEMREPDPNFSKDKHNIVSYVWEHPTLSGAPDMRYKNNQKLPVVEYGNIHIAVGSFELDILHYDKAICEQFVKAVNGTPKQTDSNVSLKTQNRIYIKKIKSLYHQSRSLKCDEDIINAVDILVKEVQSINYSQVDSSVIELLANRIQLRLTETKKAALREVYTYSIKLLSSVATDLTVTEILETLKTDTKPNANNVEDEVKGKYAESDQETKKIIKALLNERKDLLNIILSKESNHITSVNSISIDENDTESKEAMKRIHQIEDEVCKLLNASK